MSNLYDALTAAEGFFRRVQNGPPPPAALVASRALRRLVDRLGLHVTVAGLPAILNATDEDPWSAFHDRRALQDRQAVLDLRVVAADPAEVTWWVHAALQTPDSQPPTDGLDVRQVGSAGNLDRGRARTLALDVAAEVGPPHAIPLRWVEELLDIPARHNSGARDRGGWKRVRLRLEVELADNLEHVAVSRLLVPPGPEMESLRVAVLQPEAIVAEVVEQMLRPGREHIDAMAMQVALPIMPVLDRISFLDRIQPDRLELALALQRTFQRRGTTLPGRFPALARRGLTPDAITSLNWSRDACYWKQMSVPRRVPWPAPRTLADTYRLLKQIVDPALDRIHSRGDHRE